MEKIGRGHSGAAPMAPGVAVVGGLVTLKLIYVLSRDEFFISKQDCTGIVQLNIIAVRDEKSLQNEKYGFLVF